MTASYATLVTATRLRRKVRCAACGPEAGRASMTARNGAVDTAGWAGCTTLGLKAMQVDMDEGEKGSVDVVGGKPNGHRVNVSG